MISVFGIPDDLPNILYDHLAPFKIPCGVQSQASNLGPGQQHVLSPLLLHLPVLGRLALYKVLAVGSNGLQTYKEGHHLFGVPVEFVLGSTGPLEVVDSLDVSSQLGLRPCTSCGVDSQRQLQQGVATIFEVVILQRLYPRKTLQHFHHIRLQETKELFPSDVCWEDLGTFSSLSHLLHLCEHLHPHINTGAASECNCLVTDFFHLHHKLWHVVLVFHTTKVVAPFVDIMHGPVVAQDLVANGIDVLICDKVPQLVGQELSDTEECEGAHPQVVSLHASRHHTSHLPLLVPLYVDPPVHC